MAEQNKGVQQAGGWATRKFNSWLDGWSAQVDDMSANVSGWGEFISSIFTNDTAFSDTLKNIMSSVSQALQGLLGVARSKVDEAHSKIDPQGASAAQSMNARLKTAEPMFGELDAAFGTADTAKALTEDLTKFLAGGVPPALDPKGGHTAARNHIIALHDSLTSGFIDQFSRLYPGASEEAVKASAEKYAGILLGYPALKQGGDKVFKINRMGDPIPGSYGALLYAGQSRNGTIPAISFDEATLQAMAAIKTELSIDPQMKAKVAALFQQTTQQELAAKFTDLNGDNQITIDDMVKANAFAVLGDTKPEQINSIDDLVNTLNTRSQQASAPQGQSPAG